MKKSIIVLLLFLSAGVLAQKQMDQYEIQVDGLGCPFCAYGLEKKFKEFKGIKKVAIQIETGDFSFQYPSEKPLSLNDVEQQVEKAGYTPITTKITRSNGEIEISGGSATIVSDTDEVVSQSIFVAGNCDMCKARIEKTTKEISGITEAYWNKDTKLLQVHFIENTTSLKKIEKEIAKSGHDTKNFKAKKSDYDALPACCQFERGDHK